MKSKVWPQGMPLPDFASEAEEAEFWYTHRVNVPEEAWLPLDAQQYMIAIAPADALKIKRLARRQRMSESLLLTRLVHEALQMLVR